MVEAYKIMHGIEKSTFLTVTLRSLNTAVVPYAPTIQNHEIWEV